MQIPKRAARGSSTAHTTSSFLAPCMVECDRCTRSSCCLKATPHFWFVCDTLVTESCEQYHATVLNRCEVGKCVLVVRSNAHPTLSSLRSGQVCPCCAAKWASVSLLCCEVGKCVLVVRSNAHPPSPARMAWRLPPSCACRGRCLVDVRLELRPKRLRERLHHLLNAVHHRIELQRVHALSSEWMGWGECMPCGLLWLRVSQRRAISRLRNFAPLLDMIVLLQAIFICGHQSCCSVVGHV
jgi:hypothetical protein